MFIYTDLLSCYTHLGIMKNSGYPLAKRYLAKTVGGQRDVSERFYRFSRREALAVTTNLAAEVYHFYLLKALP